MAKYMSKFIIINKNHLWRMKNDSSNKFLVKRFLDVMDEIRGKLPKHNYIVCNLDEPYADKVVKIIFEGEDEKVNTKNT